MDWRRAAKYAAAFSFVCSFGLTAVVIAGINGLPHSQLSLFAWICFWVFALSFLLSLIFYIAYGVKTHPDAAERNRALLWAMAGKISFFVQAVVLYAWLRFG